MQTHLLATALTVALSTAGLAAQNRFVPDADPTTGACNVIPFGTASSSTSWSNQRYQTMVLHADLSVPLNGKLNICDIGFASCGVAGTPNITHFDRIIIRLGQTSATTLSATFSANLVANVQTVLSASNYDWHHQGETWNRIGFERDYAYDQSLGRNLVLDICVVGARKIASTTLGFHAAGRPRVFNAGWSGSCPDIGTVGNNSALKWVINVDTWAINEFGLGCKGSNGVPQLKLVGSAELGQTLGMVLDNAPPNGSAFLALGLGYYDGGFDLSILGAPGCRQYPLLNVLLGVPTNGGGQYALKVPVPKDVNLICRRFYLQFFPVDPPANPAGLTASNYALILPGL